MAFRIIPRAEWGARPPESSTPCDPATLHGVTIHWFGLPAAAKTHDRCDDLVRAVQKGHMAGEFSDIAYNHLFCPHGAAYEGRGFNRQTGANGTTAANRHYAAICYMAGHSKADGVRDEDLLDAVADLARSGVPCESWNMQRARGLLTEAVDPFPEQAQDIGAWLIAQWFERGTDRVVVPHRKWTGTSCPGPKVHPWVVEGGWKADLPGVRRVRFELWDDGGIVEQSQTVAVEEEADRLSRFLQRVDTIALERLRQEGNLGSIQIRRRTIG
jgi:hypothetical protein